MVNRQFERPDWAAFSALNASARAKRARPMSSASRPRSSWRKILRGVVGQFELRRSLFEKVFIFEQTLPSEA